MQAVLQSSVCVKLNTWWSNEKHRVALARCFVSTYFFNVWLTGLQMWSLGRGGFPILSFFLCVPAGLLVANQFMKVTGWVLLAEVSKDCITLLWGVFLTWWYRGTFYLNELMVKKLSMLGVTLLVIFQTCAFTPPARRTTASAAAGSGAETDRASTCHPCVCQIRATAKRTRSPGC